MPLPLPTEPDPLPTPPLRTIVLLLAGVALAAVAANLLLHAGLGVWRRNHDAHAAVVAGKWRTLAQRPDPVDILVVGDSSGLHGVDPDLIASATGRSCFNACAFGSLVLANESWLVQHLASIGRLPRTVLAVHVQDIWSRGPNLLRRRLDHFPADLQPWRTEPAPLSWTT